MLHIFNQPFSNYQAKQLIVDSNDSILLMSDACYTIKQFKTAFVSCKFYALEIDMRARSVENSQPVIQISDEQWVELLLSNDTHVTW